MELPQSWRTHDEKVKAYTWQHRWLRWAQTFIKIGFIAYLLISMRGLYLQWWWELRLDNPFLVWVAYFASLGGILQVIGLPFGALHHAIERKYELSKQSYGKWLSDQIKGLVVGGVLAVLALGLIYFSVRFGGEYWWVLGWFFLFLFSVVLAQLAPVLLIPIFMTLKPMEEGDLKRRLLELCKRFKVEVKDVFHLGLGEKTEKGNAAFMGLGKTKRIMIGDTLYEKYPADEVEAVFAHELGHQVHNDLWKGIFFSTLFLFLSFAISQKVFLDFVFPVFQVNVDKAFGLLLFFMVFSFSQMPFGFLQAAYSRSRERAADEFAAKTIGVGGKLADCLEKLTFQNFGYFKPNAIVEFLTYSHPAPWRRITRLRP